MYNSRLCGALFGYPAGLSTITSPKSLICTLFDYRRRYASALLAFSSGVSFTITLMPLRCALSAWSSSRRDALPSVDKVSRESSGGDGVREHPYSRVAFGPSMFVSVVFQLFCGSFHIFLRVGVSMLLIYNVCVCSGGLC